MTFIHSCIDGIERIADADFKPTCSTVPLLAWWGDRQRALSTLASIAGTGGLGDADVCYEHPTVVRGKGRGKPSMTDVLVRHADGAIAVEGKWTEPRYPIVRDWSRDSANRVAVLEYWLALIRPLCTDTSVSRADIGDVVYQMLHRIASACGAVAAFGEALVVYQVFEGGGHEHAREYIADLELAAKVLRPGPRLRLALLRVPFEVTDTWRELADVARRKADRSAVAEEIRRRIGERGALFRFGSPDFRAIAPA